jgi:hypothetical protein
VFFVMTQCICAPKYRQYFLYDGLPWHNGGVFPITLAGKGVEGLYWYFQHARENLRVEYPELGRVQSADGMLVPDELWELVVSQYNGFLAGEPLSEAGKMYLGMMQGHGTANTGLGSLMPLVSLIVLTRNQASYVVYRLNVVSKHV